MEEKYLESAIILARLYGIAETLNPWAYIENEEFIRMIKEWTDEFTGMENAELLEFFESKTK